MISTISNISYRNTFVWVPSHKGIVQNELIDRAAKHASTYFSITNLSDYSRDATIELKHYLNEKFARNWQNLEQLNHHPHSGHRHVNPVVEKKSFHATLA